METESTSGRPTSLLHSYQQNNKLFKIPSISFESISIATDTENTLYEKETAEEEEKNFRFSGEKWRCNTCNSSFDSLHDQRSHFKSDFHRFNVKLSVAGRDTVKEDDFDEWTSTSSVKDYDISSISGSEDEYDTEFGLTRGLLESKKQKLFIHLPNGELISFCKCLFLGDSEKVILENDLSGSMKDDDTPCVTVRAVTEKLFNLIHEPRNNTHFRVMLLASGGHFAGCVFDGNSVVAHKTFHRYVTRDKAGKKQSSEDASGKIAHSAGSSIRRHNELALKKAKKDAKRKASAKEVKLLRKAREKKVQETNGSSSRVAGVLALVIGRLLVIAFGQMGRGRTEKNIR